MTHTPTRSRYTQRAAGTAKIVAGRTIRTAISDVDSRRNPNWRITTAKAKVALARPR